MLYISVVAPRRGLEERREKAMLFELSRLEARHLVDKQPRGKEGEV